MTQYDEMRCEEYRRLFDQLNEEEPNSDFETTPVGERWHAHGAVCPSCIDWIRERTVKDRGFDVSDFPCVHMAYYATFRCEEHDDPWECPDCVLVYSPRIDEYGLPVRDGGKSVTGIAHCPWCGVRLPDSKREMYIQRLVSLGFEDFQMNEKIPDEFKTDEWWRKRAVFPRWWPYKNGEK